MSHAPCLPGRVHQTWTAGRLWSPEAWVSSLGFRALLSWLVVPFLSLSISKDSHTSVGHMCEDRVS